MLFVTLCFCDDVYKGTDTEIVVRFNRWRHNHDLKNPIRLVKNILYIFDSYISLISLLFYTHNNVTYSFRKRPSVRELLGHPWLNDKPVHVPPVVPADSAAKTTTTIPFDPVLPPHSQPSQRKSLSATSYNCLCTQCGTNCRHAPVTKTTTITVDRGILC